jgi:hypothetical protein
MKTLLEDIGLSGYGYEENGKLCGYEISTYTDGGVNIVVFFYFPPKKLLKQVIIYA